MGDEEQEILPGGQELEEFCHALKVERNASDHTIRAYHIDLDDYLRWCNGQDIDPFTVSHRQIRAYLGDLDRARYTRTTINRRLSALRSFFRWLNVTGKVDVDPSSVVQGPNLSHHLPETLRAKDMARLLSVYAAQDLEGNPQKQGPEELRNLALLEFLYACGARVSEASGLKIDNVDFGLAQVKVFGKGAKERIIPLHQLALRTMREYLLHARPSLLRDKNSEFFFVSTRGNAMSPDAIRKMFKVALRKAGLDESLTPHAMRHSFATDMLAGGADLRTVQEMLGHVNLSTTQIYTHVTAERLRSAHAQAHPRA